MCLLLLISCQSDVKPTGQMVKIKKVISGQTVEIVNSNNQGQKLRLLGIDAPDIKQQPWGISAKNYLEQLVTGQDLILEIEQSEKDQYNRLLGYIWLGNVLINEELIKAGYVLYSPYLLNSKYNQRFANAQDYARIMGLGVWNPQNHLLLTPSEFRRQNN